MSTKRQILNLHNLYYSTLKYKSFDFPDGQPGIEIDFESGTEVSIIACLDNGNELLRVLLATQILRDYGYRHIDLNITYLLGARMDRKMASYGPFTLKVIADIINSQKYNRVNILDPHSNMSLDLINNSYAILPQPLIRMAFDAIKLIHPGRNRCVLFPDEGAKSRYDNLRMEYENALYCIKSRDIHTGTVTSLQIVNSEFKPASLDNNDIVIIVDDLCDGGKTFIEASRALPTIYNMSLFLIVTHGIFSKGLTELDKHFSKIFTTNSFTGQSKNISGTPSARIASEKLVQLKLQNAHFTS